jgi:hypothetical protein
MFASTGQGSQKDSSALSNLQSQITPDTNAFRSLDRQPSHAQPKSCTAIVLPAASLHRRILPTVHEVGSGSRPPCRNEQDGGIVAR